MDGIDLGKARDRSPASALEPGGDVLHGCGVVTNVQRALRRLTARGLECDDRLAADPLDQAARQSPIACRSDGVSVGIDELEFDRGRADV
jgi:hypothetical protein